MPAEAVALDVDVNDIDGDDVDKVRAIVSNVGFHPHPYDDGVIGGILNYQPFEDTEENRDLIETCVDRLADEFPNADVSYEIRKNRDAGRVVGRDCYLTIKRDSGDDEERTAENNQTRQRQDMGDGRVGAPIGGEDADSGPEWRASFDDREESDPEDSGKSRAKRFSQTQSDQSNTDQTVAGPEESDESDTEQQQAESDPEAEHHAADEAQHTLYEDAPARIEIEYEYDAVEDTVEPVDREILDREDVKAPVLYCECGAEFMEWDPAIDHLRQSTE